MNSVDHSLFNAALRQDLYSFTRKTFNTLNPGQTFVPEWYIQAITYQLERVRRGEINRLIINLPPRSLKSITASVAFPAFILGHDPTQRIERIYVPTKTKKTEFLTGTPKEAAAKLLEKLKHEARVI